MNEAERGNLRRRMQRIDELVQTLEALDDPNTRAAARELFQTVLSFHRDGLDRLLEIVRQSASGGAIAADCARDDLVSGVLLLHGLHPVALETRVRQALRQVHPVVRGHGGDLELISLVGGRIRLRLLGPCSLSAAALEHALEEAFTALAPDAEGIEVEEITVPAEPTTRLLSLPLIP
jgi:Fe-S cluster biogenesis protein NfuA